MKTPAVSRNRQQPLPGRTTYAATRCLVFRGVLHSTTASRTGPQDPASKSRMFYRQAAPPPALRQQAESVLSGRFPIFPNPLLFNPKQAHRQDFPSAGGMYQVSRDQRISVR